jgi:hypothetical protein
MITRLGPWTVLRWFPKNKSPSTQRIWCARVIAKNGLLVYAGLFSDDGRRSNFVHTETPSDEADLEAAFKAYDAKLEAKEIP